MPTPITICQVPDEVREELAARAALSGRTLEDYVRSELIALAQRPSAAVWMARVRARCMGEAPAGEGSALESGVDHGIEGDLDHAPRRDVG